MATTARVMGEFASQRRVIVGYDEINPLIRQGLIATEDTEFARATSASTFTACCRRRPS